MDDVQYTVHLLGWVTLIALIINFPYMVKKFDRYNDKWTFPELTFLFIYIIAGFGIVSIVISFVYMWLIIYWEYVLTGFVALCIVAWGIRFLIDIRKRYDS